MKQLSATPDLDSRLRCGWRSIANKLLWLCCLLPSLAWLQPGASAVDVGLSGGNASAGGTLTSSLTLAGNTNAVGLQMDVVYDAPVLSLTSVSGGAALGGRVLANNLIGPGTQRLLFYSTNLAQLANGELARLLISISTDAPAGARSVTVTNLILGDASGKRLTNAVALPAQVIILGGSQLVTLGEVVYSENGVMRFNLHGPGGKTYTIQSSADLVRWDDAGTLLSTGGPVSFSDPSAGQSRRKFYRAIAAP